MYNINFILSDIDRLKDKRSLNTLINNWELLSFDKSRAFSKILETVLETYKNSTKITDNDMAQLSGTIIKKLCTERNDYMELEFGAIKSKLIDNPECEKDITINEKFLNPLLDAINNNKKRIIIENNHIKLNNSIGIDNYILENNLIYNQYDALEGIYNLCELVELAYPDITIKQKLRICVENILYAYNKSKCGISDDIILESIMDYFLIKNECDLSMLEDVLIDVKSSDKCKVKDKINKLKNKDNGDITILLELDKDPIKVFLSKLLLDIKDSNSYNTSKQLADSIVKKLYKIPKDDLLEDMPHIIGFIRRTILYGGSIVISPYLTIPVIIIDIIIHQKINKDQCDRVLKDLNNEKKNVEKKLKTANSKVKDELNKYLSAIETQIDRVDLYKRNLYSELENDDIDKIDINKEMANILAIEEEIYPGTYIKENSAVTILRTAREKITKGLEKASAAEKAASRSLDRTLEKLQQDIASSVAIKERDRVIKGKILPSASKTIKWGITAGVAYAINPVLAVIGSLGAMAVAKTANARERQLILDEIDVHLKIVEKKISQAEMNNDLKNMENLLKIENKLQREKQRIKYRMKVYYNQNV